MNCRKIREKLPEYYYGEMTEEQAETVTSHLEKCPLCSSYFKETVQALDGLRPERPELPQRFWDELQRKLIERIEKRKRRPLLLLRPVYAVAAALMVIMAGWAGYRYYEDRAAERFISDNYDLLYNLEFYENLELLEHLEEIELMGRV